MSNMLKYETREQFINRFLSLVEIENDKYLWNGDVDKNNIPIFKFNGIILYVRKMISVWSPSNMELNKKLIINKNIVYNSKKDIYI